MSTCKKLTSLILSLAMLLTLAACGEKDPAKVLEEANQKAAAAKSVEATLTIDAESAVDGESAKLNYVMDMACFIDPMKMRCDMDIDIMGEHVKTEMYLQKDEDEYDLYINIGGQWIAQSIDADEMPQMQPQESMDIYLKGLEDVKDAGSETLDDGTEAHRYDGVVRGDAMADVVRSSGALEAVSVGDEDEMLEVMLKDLGDLKLSVWVDTKSGYPARISMDMTELMNSMMKNLAGAAETEPDVSAFSKMVIVADYRNFDAVEDFELPADAIHMDT